MHSRTNSTTYTRTLICNAILGIHSHVEELHVYPIIRDVIKEGPDLIDRSLTEHREVKQHLYELDQFSGSLGTNPKACVHPHTAHIRHNALTIVTHPSLSTTELASFPDTQTRGSQKHPASTYSRRGRTNIPRIPKTDISEGPFRSSRDNRCTLIFLFPYIFHSKNSFFSQSLDCTDASAHATSSERPRCATIHDHGTTRYGRNGQSERCDS